MNNFQKNYVSNLKNYFGSKYNDDERMFRTMNRFLNFNKKKMINENDRLLDLGSGTGSFVKVCSKYKVSSVGLDLAKDNLNFENDKLPLKDNEFDFITMINLIEHIKDQKNLQLY